MTKIPKELTPELLSLVLKEEIADRVITDNIQLCGDTMHYMIKDSYMAQINIDTLTRLCKEWCLEQDGMINVYYHQDTVAVSISLDNGLTKYSSPSMTEYSELEAIIKATHWAATEKGLI